MIRKPSALRWFAVSMVTALSLLGLMAGTVTASPILQGTAIPTAYRSPTPLPDGRILYTVLPGDTLWKISAITGVSIDDLERLNGIRREDPLTPGTQLVIGIAPASTVEPTLAFQATPSPSPLPVTGTGTICVMFFDDTNGDGARQETEALAAGGEVSVALSDGTEVGTYTTNGVDEPHCMENAPAGLYNIGAAAPKNTNPTTETNVRDLKLEPGETLYVSFGVQTNVPGPIEPTAEPGTGSPILGVAGLVLLVGAGLLIAYIRRPRRRSHY